MLPVIVIPAYQPEKTLLDVIRKLKEYHTDQPIIIVDDGSTTPESQEVFEAVGLISNITLLKHPHNLGKGRALKTAFKHFLAHFPDSPGVITADADGQHLPEDIQKISQALLACPQKLILGTRVFEGDIPWRSRFGNTLTRKIFKLFSGYPLEDTQTGLRGIPRTYLEDLLAIHSEGYAFEMEMLMSLIRKKVAIQQVPISTIYIENNRTSHFNPLLDSLRIYFVFFRYSILSIISACIDFILFFICFHFSRHILFSTIFARVFSGIFNFIYCKKLIFKSNGHIAKEAGGYLVLAVSSMIFSYVLVSLFFHVLKFNIFFSKLFGDSLIFIGNFIIQHTLIFRRKA